MNDCPFDQDGKLKPQHMRIPPLVQSISNVTLSQHASTVLLNPLHSFFLLLPPFSRFNFSLRKYCFPNVRTAQIDLLYAHAEFINDHFQLWVSDWFRKRDSSSSRMTLERPDPRLSAHFHSAESGPRRTVSAGGTFAVETESKMFADAFFARDSRSTDFTRDATPTEMTNGHDFTRNVFDINMESVEATVQRGPVKATERSIEKVGSYTDPYPCACDCSVSLNRKRRFIAHIAVTRVA